MIIHTAHTQEGVPQEAPRACRLGAAPVGLVLGDSCLVCAAWVSAARTTRGVSLREEKVPCQS